MAVVDRDDDRARPHAQVSAQRLVGGLVAEHEAAAVEPDDEGMRARRRRSPEAVLEVAFGARQHAVDDLADLGPRRAHCSDRGHEGPRVRGRQRLDRREAHRRHRLEDQRHVGLHPPDDAIVAPGPVRSVESQAEVVLGHHLVARGAEPVDPADVGQEDPGLARHVGAHVPRVRPRVERDGGVVVDVLDPSRLGRLGRLDRRSSPRRADPRDAVATPKSTCCSIDTIMFDRTDGLPGPVIVKRLGKPARHEPEVGRRPVGPLLPQREAVAPGDVDGDHRAGHGVEPGGVDDRVERRTTRRRCRCPTR